MESLKHLADGTKEEHFKVYQRALACQDPDAVEKVAQAFDEAGAYWTATDLYDYVDRLDTFSGSGPRKRKRNFSGIKVQSPPDPNANKQNASQDSSQDDGSTDFGFGDIIPSTYVPPVVVREPDPISASEKYYSEMR